MSKIGENVGVDFWRYVPTDYNSADVATKYKKIPKFEEVLWWKGPSFICEGEDEWPKSECGDASDLNQDMGKVLIMPAFSPVSVQGNICCDIDCERYSSLEKLLKVTCFEKKFLRNLKARVGRGEFSKGE